MLNGRCRMHGGKFPGAPKGNRNARKHGRYSAEAIALRRLIRRLSSDAADLAGAVLGQRTQVYSSLGNSHRPRRSAREELHEVSAGCWSEALGPRARLCQLSHQGNRMTDALSEKLGSEE